MEALGHRIAYAVLTRLTQAVQSKVFRPVENILSPFANVEYLVKAHDLGRCLKASPLHRHRIEPNGRVPQQEVRSELDLGVVPGVQAVDTQGGKVAGLGQEVESRPSEAGLPLVRAQLQMENGDLGDVRDGGGPKSAKEDVQVVAAGEMEVLVLIEDWRGFGIGRLVDQSKAGNQLSLLVRAGGQVVEAPKPSPLLTHRRLVVLVVISLGSDRAVTGQRQLIDDVAKLR